MTLDRSSGTHWVVVGERSCYSRGAYDTPMSQFEELFETARCRALLSQTSPPHRLHRPHAAKGRPLAGPARPFSARLSPCFGKIE